MIAPNPVVVLSVKVSLIPFQTMESWSYPCCSALGSLPWWPTSRSYSIGFFSCFQTDVSASSYSCFCSASWSWTVSQNAISCGQSLSFDQWHLSSFQRSWCCWWHFSFYFRFQDLSCWAFSFLCFDLELEDQSFHHDHPKYTGCRVRYLPMMSFLT